MKNKQQHIMMIETFDQNAKPISSSQSDSSGYFDHNDKYNAMFQSDMDQSKQDKRLLRQKRFTQKKYLQHVFYIIILINICTILLYIISTSLKYWYYFDVTNDQSSEGQIWLTFIYVYIKGEGIQSYSKAKLKCKELGERAENCHVLLSNFQFLGIISFICIVIGIILSSLHCYRVYKLTKGQEVGIQGTVIFSVNTFLFLEPPISYFTYVLFNTEKLSVSHHNFGVCFYGCSALMILFSLVMVYYKLVKNRKEEDDMVDELLFNAQSSNSVDDFPQQVYKN